MKTLRLPISNEKLNLIKNGLKIDIRPVNKFYISRLKFDIWNPKPFEKIEYFTKNETLEVDLVGIKVKGNEYLIEINNVKNKA